jgi:hypothetical protein
LGGIRLAETGIRTYGLLIKVIPSEVNVSVTEVTDELVSGSGDGLHEGALQDTDEADDLDKAGGGDGVGSEKGGNTVGERVEGVSGVVDGSRKVDSGTGDDLAQEGELGDTSVLDFDVTEAFEAGLVFAAQLSERIEEAEGGLGSELILECLQGGGGGGLLRGGESGGGGDEGCEDCGLHLDCVL